MGDHLAEIDLGQNLGAVQITAGFKHTCALLENGQIKCWGLNNVGQCGVGDTSDRGDEPVEMGDDLEAVNLGNNLTVSYITAGANHTCALFTNARVKCWGFNSYGQCGTGDPQNRGTDEGEMGDNLPFVDVLEAIQANNRPKVATSKKKCI